jgi:hypothetical protein
MLHRKVTKGVAEGESKICTIEFHLKRRGMRDRRISFQLGGWHGV